MSRDSEPDQNLSGDFQKIFSSDLNEIWYVGRGRWVMHDGMPYVRNQGQGHSREVDRQSPTGLIFCFQSNFAKPHFILINFDLQTRAYSKAFFNTTHTHGERRSASL